MVEVNNLTRSRIEKALFKRIAENVLRKEKSRIDLSVAFVGQAVMKELNKKYRRKDKSTDVLSFSYGQAGEVVICPEVVKANAQEYGVSAREELRRVLIHGILHILGYSHKEMAGKFSK